MRLSTKQHGYRNWCALLCTGVLAFAASTTAFAALEEALSGGVMIKSQEAVVHVPLKNATQNVSWLAKPIKADGDLADWKANGVQPIKLSGAQYATWIKGDYAGGSDLNVELYLGYDAGHMYVAIVANDDIAPAPSRFEISFANPDAKVIEGWQDVGMRYGANDIHNVFYTNDKKEVGMYWAKTQNYMDYSVVHEAMGSEAERRALLEQGKAEDPSKAKIFAQVKTDAKDGKSTTVFEVAYPWKALIPHDPVKNNKIKFNFVVHDKDEVDGAAREGVAAWMPGLYGTTSAAHYTTLVFQPPAKREPIAIFAQLPLFHYVNMDIAPSVSIFNAGGATSGELKLFAEGKAEPLSTAAVEVPAGLSEQKISVHSEKVGLNSANFKLVYADKGGKTYEIPVFAPTAGNVSIQNLAEITALLNRLKTNVSSFSNRYDQVKSARLDLTYPKAYLTLLTMFISSSEASLARGDSDRVIRNINFLGEVHKEANAYVDMVLKDRSKQFTTPKFKPDQLKLEKGAYHSNGKPMFLWGPCVFWFLRGDQQKVIDLGFNSVTPELPMNLGKDHPEIVSQMKRWYDAGILVNASMHVPELNFTGADIRASKLLQEHPEIKNLDGNNFLSFLIQHPRAREEIKKGFTDSINFWRGFPAVRTYWLWNEPWYTNYSEMTRQGFIKDYLKPLYKNDIAALNKRWKSNYRSFEDIKLVDWPDAKNYAPWYDFQKYRDVLLGDFFGFLAKTAKSVDSSRHTHTKYMSASLHSFNIEELQSYTDISGHDGSVGDRDIMFLDFCRSVYPDKLLSNTEVHIGYTGKEGVSIVPWRLALHGLADAGWWCWHSNPRFSDSIENAESMYSLAIPGLDIQRLYDPYIYNLARKGNEIATLFPDVVERRSDITMVRLRFESGVAQYALGRTPHYETEKRIMEGSLKDRKFLFAPESKYVRDAVYDAVVKFVAEGGTLITTAKAFPNNEYGDPRDTTGFIKNEGGEPYGEHAKIYDYGKGQIIRIDDVELLEDAVPDGGQSMRGGPLFEHHTRRRVYQDVLGKVMAYNKLNDPIRVVAKEDAENKLDALYGTDWRCIELKDGSYAVIVLQYGVGKVGLEQVKLETVRPIVSITDLVSGKEIPADKFTFGSNANLYKIELAK